jgi:butyryl-CoA dehydrogenase
VERTFPGVSPGPEEKKMGIKGSSTTPLILEDARVPVENVLGEIGKGHKIAFNVLNVGRLKLGACVTGGAKYITGEAAQYANLRKQFGRTIGSFGAIREKFADMVAATYASESVAYRVGGMVDDRLSTLQKGIDRYYDAYQAGIEEYSMECAIAKVFCSDAMAIVADHAVQIYGGYGYTQEYPAERAYRDERINRIFEGTNEVNRMLIPGTLLKRAFKQGIQQFTEEVMKAVGRLSAPAADPPAVPFGAEKQLLRNLKDAFLVLIGQAAQRFTTKIQEEQEVLMALADLAIGCFALESAILRAEKIASSGNAMRKEMSEAAAKVFAFQAQEDCSSAARRAAFYIGEGPMLKTLLTGIRRSGRYEAAGLLEAKRRLAAATLEKERYPIY